MAKIERSKDPAKVLRSARKYLDIVNHWKRGDIGVAFDPVRGETTTVSHGRVCAMGAVRLAVEPRPVGKNYWSIRERVVEAARSYLEEAVEDLHPSPLPKEFARLSIEEFNDDKATRHRDILLVFDRAIELAERDG